MVLTGHPNVHAIQAAMNANGAAPNAQQRFGWPGMPPMLGGAMQTQFYPQLQAAAAAQEIAAPVVAVTKLGESSSNPASNSSLVVRSSVRKMNGNELVSVGMWTRKVVENNLEWLVKLAKRHYPEEEAVLLAFGDGCETLVLFDKHINKMPKDFASVKKIGIGVSVAGPDEKGDESELAKLGVLQSGDSVWEHLRFQQMETSAAKRDKCMFIHTSMTVWSEGVEGRQRVYQVKTKAPAMPCMAVSLIQNVQFEQALLATWKGKPMGAALSTAAMSGFTAPIVPPKTVITFNPKELLLLEKAFDNALTPRDLKTDVNKHNAEDKKKCQSVIRRAKDEIVSSTKKKRAKKAIAAKKPAAKSAPISSKKKASVKVATPKKAKDDSDDEKPISALKPKGSARSPAKKSKTPKGKGKEAAKEKETATKKRGRPSKTTSTKASEPVTKKGRKSKGRK